MKYMNAKFFCSVVHCRVWVAAALFIALFSTPVSADIYMYIDRDGVMHFTNVPNSAQYRLFLKNPEEAVSRNPKKFDHLISEASKTYGISFPLVKAIIKAESDFNPRAVSRKGAMGLMQLMPGTADILSVQDPFDPYENIMGGTRYFKSLLERFNGNTKLALAGYNAGPTKVEEYNGIPPYTETQEYVQKVIRFYRILKNDDQ